MKILDRTGREDLSFVYLAEIRDGHHIEFVESLQPPIPREKKWVFVISTLLGCPVKCSMCDAGGWYKGRLTREEILAQIDYMVDQRYENRKVPVEKFKIQFCRMGEPSFNPAVLTALQDLPHRYQCSGIKPSISTVAPKGTEGFFRELKTIKENLYPRKNFQLQFSIHTTNLDIRKKIIPIKTWDFSQIADYGSSFYQEGDQKITLNFALAENHPLEASVLAQYFDPDIFLIKITPLNPTVKCSKTGINSLIRKDHPTGADQISHQLSQRGYDVLISLGCFEEDQIGSNCGQYVRRFLDNQGKGGEYQLAEKERESFERGKI